MEESRLNAGGNTDKNATIIKVLSGVAVLLVLVLAYVLFSKSKLISELNEEKADLTEQFVALQQDYAQLSSDYEVINTQLDSSREEVNQLVERIQKISATDRAQIRKYQKELGTLRAIMRNYVHQIDSLNTLNHKLSAQAAAAKKEAAAAKKENAELKKSVEDLSGKVVVGATLRARNIKADAYNKNGKRVERATPAARILTTLSIAENSLAEKGPVRVYVVITDPDGNILTNAESRVCSTPDGDVQTSASREVDYQGDEVEISIYMNDIPKYEKGVYNVQVLTAQGSLGSVQFMLR